MTLEYSGQIIKLSAYDKPARLGITITKRGNAEVLAGNQMRYDFTVANTSNVPLDSFFWHDRIPTDAAAATVLTTGTYSTRLNYRILYKTNYQTSYQVLASNLLTTTNYSFALNAIPKQAGEVVTDIYFDFGKVPAGFQSLAGPTLTVNVSGTAVNGYQLVNRADAGGKYQAPGKPRRQLGHDHSQIYDYTSTAQNRLLTLDGWPSMEGYPSPVYFETCPYQRRSP
mgnify:CR=1 FL=1